MNKTKLSYILALAVPLAGCATAKPRSLEEAQNILASKDLTNYSNERPKLVAEAKGEVKKGEDALARGNSEEAALRGHIALAKLNTARNFVERGEARAMSRAVAENDEATASERARFAELEKKLTDSSKGQTGPAFDGAKRAIMVARDRQADAIREGAPVKASVRYDEGKRLVENAIESLSMKQNVDAKRSAERATATFDAAIAMAKGATERAPAKEVVVAPAPRPAPTRAPDVGYTGPVGDMRTLAENKIVELQLRKTELLGLLRDENCKAPFREFDATLDLAQKRLDARDYAKAFEFAVRAAERMRVCDRGPSGPAFAGAIPGTGEPKADPKEALRKQQAASSLARAQEEIARAQSTREPSDPILVQAQTLVAKAESWFEKQSYPEAESFAKQAITVLAQAKREPAPKPAQNGKEKLDPAQEARNAISDATERLARAKALGDVEDAHIAVADELLKSAEASYEKQLFESSTALAKKAKAELDAKGAKKAPGKLDAKVAGKDKVDPKAKPGADAPQELPQEIDWKTAYDSITKAQAARDRVRGDRTTTDAYKKGSDALAQAKAAYQEKNFGKANDSARAAEDAFNSASGLRARAQEGAEPVVEKDAKDKPTEKAGDKVAAGDGSVKTAAASADPAVAYRKVTEALTRRDRVQKALRPSDKPAFTEAGQTLGLARGAWAEKDYGRAGNYASMASAKYDQIADALKAAGVVRPGEDVVDARKAEEELREAKLALELCERGQCMERDSTTFLRGKGLVESASRTFAQGDHTYAFKLAEQGRKNLNDALAAKGPKEEDPKELARKQETAEAALRETSVLAEVCRQQNCSATDMENTLRAEQLFKAARTAMDSKRYPLVKELADESRGIFRKVIDSKPKFSVPDTSKRVSLKGDQLFVEPSVQYVAGTTKLDKNSEPSVSEVADTIKKNLGAIRGIRLVGYTDNSGNAAANVKLSKGRAQALADSLAAHGVPTGLMNADGRGSENPIANNGTDAGRKQNRRVEIHIDLK